MKTLSSPETQEKKRASVRYFSSYDIENIDLKKIKQENPEKNVILFFVPFDKYSLEEVKYEYKSFEASTFECFYKYSEITINEIARQNSRFKEIISLFPTRWEKIIPYTIEKKLMFMINKDNENIYNIIMQSLLEIQEKTILKFKFVTKQKNSDFMCFVLGTENCAIIGKHKGINFIKLKNNVTKADIFHQIMHSLGFMHQHRKNDGEVFAYLTGDEVLNSSAVDNRKYACISGIESGGFDERSVLNIQSCKSMISFNSRAYSEEIGLSEVDIAKINFFYDDRNFYKSEKKVNFKLEKLKEMAGKSLVNEKSIEYKESEDSMSIS